MPAVARSHAAAKTSSAGCSKRCATTSFTAAELSGRGRIDTAAGPPTMSPISAGSVPGSVSRRPATIPMLVPSRRLTR